MTLVDESDGMNESESEDSLYVFHGPNGMSRRCVTLLKDNRKEVTNVRMH